ncbi:RNA polymerase subunit sigma-70 [filamentous cyanobacterium CCP5]|nr:RNA polymerase subunit sigma-70 [filamentous cyanobacterium CCP5]
MQLPHFPECDRTLVQSLFHHTDQELVKSFQQHPEAGCYFTALFCRYSSLVYSLIRHSAKSPVQAEYLFALTWRHIFHELGGLDCSAAEDSRPQGKAFSLQGWLINVTALCINQAVIPEVESIHYSLQKVSPPFWCYIEQALDQLAPAERLMVLMARTFRWSETRIAAYLQAEGERITPAQVKARLQDAYQQLQAAMPADIQGIYLDDWAAFEGSLNATDLGQFESSSLDQLMQVPELATAREGDGSNN